MSHRLRYFEAASLRGHKEGSYLAAMLLLYGSEELANDYKPRNPDCALSPQEVSGHIQAVV